LHHPGPRRSLHRGRRAHPLHLELTPEAPAADPVGRGKGRGQGMTTWTERLENPFSARLRDPSVSGFAALPLAAFAAVLPLPPIQARTILWPILVGVIACLLGIWTATRGRRRLGYGSVAAGLIGIGLGILATRSSTGHLNAVFDAVLISQTLGFATPLTFGA